MCYYWSKALLGRVILVEAFYFFFFGGGAFFFFMCGVCGLFFACWIFFSLLLGIPATACVKWQSESFVCCYGILTPCSGEVVAYAMGLNVVLNDYAMLITFLYMHDCLVLYSYNLPRLFYQNSFE